MTTVTIDDNEEARGFAEGVLNDVKEEGFWYSSAVDVLSAIVLKIQSENKGNVSFDAIEYELNQAETEPNYFSDHYENMSENHIAYEYFKILKTMQGKSKAHILSTIKNQLQ